MWRKIYYDFVASYFPRSIGRHEIISYLFYNKKFASSASGEELRRTYDNRVNYFRDRTLVEIAIAINRNNGIVDIVELLNDRVGFYYDRYIRMCELNKDSQVSHRYTIYELISQFSDEEFDFAYSRNVFRIGKAGRISEQWSQLCNKYREANSEVTDEYMKILKNSFLKRWIIYNYIGDGGESKNADNPDYKLVTSMIELLDISNNSAAPEKVLAKKLLQYLFSTNLLSSFFIKTLKDNYKLLVYNGNHDMTASDPPTIFSELIRLFSKSSRNNYYHITPNFQDRKNYIVESFSRSNILHTNLSLGYHIKNLFLDKQWDIALIISETGSVLDFFAKDDGTYLLSKLGDKVNYAKIVVLNSFEAVRQIHNRYDRADDIDIQEMCKNHYSHLFFSQSTQAAKMKNESLPQGIKIWPETSADIRLVPFWQHNHHMLVFLKCISGADMLNVVRNKYPTYSFSSDNDRVAQKGFAMVGGLYMYRKGFSNKISPVLIGNNSPFTSLRGTENDFIKMLNLFFIHFCRSVAHEFLTTAAKKEKASDSKDSDNRLKGYEHYKDYVTWNGEEDQRYRNEYFEQLFDEVLKKKGSKE